MERLTERFGGFFSRLGNGRWRRFVIIAGIAAIALLFLSTVIPAGGAQQPQDSSAEDAEEVKSSSSGDSLSSENSPALTGSKDALEKSVILPKVRGVAVVCGGAENMLVREKVVNTAARVLDIGVSQVYVTN